MPSQLTWKKSLLLTCQILGLLVNILASDEKSPLLKRDNLTTPIQMQLSLKDKDFSVFFAPYLKFRLNFKYLEKKKMTLIDILFLELRFPKTWSDKRLKSPVSDDYSTSNMVNVPNQCWKLHDSTFIIFIDHCQVNWVGKSFCFWHANYLDGLLKHWLPMKSILFLRKTI